ncbi:MAG TPA: flagellar basal body-associated FliL family protein [Gemmataceae bacterium]|nr:flagellar basal body-associated FliL family protein [Gemmataceae bacterium]
MANETTAPPAKSGGKMMLILLAACGVLALAAGGAVPIFLMHEPAPGKHDKEDGHHASSSKQAYVPFGDPVVVNLNEDRLTRYLKIKLLLVVDASEEKTVNELVLKKKPALKNWLIANLSDKSLSEVSGAAGLNKMRREIWHQFNSELFPDGAEKVLDIFFEEFVVQ